MAHNHPTLIQFETAKPFPHLVMDGFMEDAATRRFVEELPPTDAPIWKEYQKGKRGCRDIDKLSDFCQNFVREFVMFVRDCIPVWTSYQHVYPDTSFAGGGLHATGRGGALGVHVDFNELKKIKGRVQGPLYRVINTFLYLNEEWEPGWGGALDLHDKPKDNGPGPVVRSIQPEFNRFVMFESSDSSWHGHAQPLRCPSNRERLSLAVYWYTKEKPKWFRERHSTVYVK